MKTYEERRMHSQTAHWMFGLSVLGMLGVFGFLVLSSTAFIIHGKAQHVLSHTWSIVFAVICGALALGCLISSARNHSKAKYYR